MVRHKPQGRMSMFPHLYFILFYTFSSFLPIWPFEQLTLYLPAVFSSGEQKVVFMFRLQSGKSRPSLITTAQDIYQGLFTGIIMYYRVNKVEESSVSKCSSWSCMLYSFLKYLWKVCWKPEYWKGIFNISLVLWTKIDWKCRPCLGNWICEL